MSPYLKALSRETGKSVKELEPIWRNAKEITSDTFGKREKDFGSKEYSYARETALSMMGVREELLDVTQFLNSEASAKEYIEQLSGGIQTSSDFDIGNVVPPKDDKKKKKKKKKDDEEKDKIAKEDVEKMNEELSEEDEEHGKFLDKMFDEIK